MKRILSLLYLAVLITMSTATFVESSQGTPFVHQHIYGAWWFTVLWALLAILGAAFYLAQARHPRKCSWPSALLHLSFLVILAGALLSHLTARSGRIHLRLDEPQDIATIEHNGRQYLHRLKSPLLLTDFRLIGSPTPSSLSAPTDYTSTFLILPAASDAPADTLRVSMNHIATHGNIRFYQASYDSDLRGSTLLINRDPYGIPVTYCGYALLLAGFVLLCLKTFRRKGSLGYLLLSLVIAALWCVWYFILDGSWQQIPVLRSPILFVHVVTIILAYALLLVQTVVSAVALVRKSPATTSVLLPALAFLCAGIFIGAVWANISWGNYWSWDPKETWALITLLIYAVPIHKKSLPLFRRPRVFHTYLLLAFLAVLMTYLGVNLLLPGLHSYA